VENEILLKKLNTFKLPAFYLVRIHGKSGETTTIG